MLLSRLMIFNQREEECRQMEAYFEGSGYGVICCSDLDELMEMISKGRHKPEVFVFYIDDSGRRGYEIIEKIRAVSDMAIIVISKDIRLDTQLYAYSKRIDDYMEDRCRCLFWRRISRRSSGGFRRRSCLWRQWARSRLTMRAERFILMEMFSRSQQKNLI